MDDVRAAIVDGLLEMGLSVRINNSLPFSDDTIHYFFIPVDSKVSTNGVNYVRVDFSGSNLKVQRGFVGRTVTLDLNDPLVFEKLIESAREISEETDRDIVRTTEEMCDLPGKAAKESE